MVIAGGGTTGHLSPGLAVAAVLREAGNEILFIGSVRGPEGRIVAKLGYEFRSLDVEGRGPGRLNVRNLRAVSKLVLATARCIRILRCFSPSVVVGTGGYASLPAAAAAQLCRLPLVIHEQNSVPGLANRVARRFADRVGVSFPGSEALLGGQAVLVGNPVRSELIGLDRAALRDNAAAEFGLDPTLPTLLAFGGSQGAQSINRALVGAYDQLRGAKIQILHLTGSAEAQETSKQIKDLHRNDDSITYRVVGYTDRMDLAYSCGDLALCRSGASTIAELAMVGMPAIFVPLPISLDGDQRRNAEAVVEAGGAELILDRELSPAQVVRVVETRLVAGGHLERMSQQIRRLARPDAAQRLADLVLGVLS
ncbi:MAG: undecaprenyldiphospho-muramoylpentapeptide beta-N-acetylglucosaminyltransferase [Actinomycetota bacterium]